MAHYAFLDDSNIVTEIIVGIDETELIEGKTPEDWYSEFRGQKCVRTSYSSSIRFNYAGIGYSYDSVDDAFIAPVPCKHDELLLNAKKRWECSVCDELTKAL
jgi:hypothetical protein